MSSNLAITTFNIDRYTSLEGFLADYQAIGLNTLELNSRVPSGVIDALRPLVDSGAIRIASLHNFCPRLEGDESESPSLSSLDQETRARAVRLTMGTVNTAVELGASAVVLHPGEVDGLRPLQDGLAELFRSGEAENRSFARLRALLTEQRRQRKNRYAMACEASLEQIANYVEQRGNRVRLGLETPFYHSQLPSLAEYDLWFEKLPEAPIDLWYDVGHWQVQANLGLVDRCDLLDRHAGRLLGLHIHDCSGTSDHQVPGEGQIDFTFLSKYLRPGVLRVLEYGRFIQPLGRILSGIEHLKSTHVI